MKLPDAPQLQQLLYNYINSRTSLFSYILNWLAQILQSALTIFNLVSSLFIIVYLQAYNNIIVKRLAFIDDSCGITG